MNLEIFEISDTRISLKAPLGTHINYEGTAFGGSLNTICTLSCYLSVHHLLKLHQVEFQSLVIQKSDIHFLKPVEMDFRATCEFPNYGKVQNFIKMLKKREVARLQISSLISTDKDFECVKFTGYFVAKL